jgi:hypothetical protein
MKLYTISGLGADHRVFDQLHLDCPVEHLPWLNPKKKEDIALYAQRMASQISNTGPIGIMGVSFGGLIAVEMSKRLKPQLTILISSVETKNELPRLYRFLGMTRIIPRIPHFFFVPPKRLMHWVFGAKNKDLLSEILNDADTRFTRWALHALCSWRNQQLLSNPALRIGGSQDKLLPPRYTGEASILAGGKHFMIVDRANEISGLINSRFADG